MKFRASMTFLGLLFGTLAQAGTPTPAELRALSAGAEIREAGGNIIELRADSRNFTPADYQLIGSVTSLKSLTLGGQPGTLTDDNLARLSGLSNLESLSLEGSVLSDDGYRHFAAFPRLQRLALFHPSRDRADFTGSGLAHLRHVPSLTRLTFAGATAGDEYLLAVSQIGHLKEFAEWHNKETADGLRHLLQLRSLTSLKLGQRLPNYGKPTPPSLDDSTLAVIAQMPSLEKLDLQEARLSMAGLSQLQDLPHLKELHVKWVHAPPEDVARLGEVLPRVKIDWEPISAEEVDSLLVKKLRL